MVKWFVRFNECVIFYSIDAFAVKSSASTEDTIRWATILVPDFPLLGTLITSSTNL